MEEKKNSIVKQSQQMTLLNLLTQNQNGEPQKPMSLMQHRFRYHIIAGLQDIIKKLPKTPEGYIDTKNIRNETVVIDLYNISQNLKTARENLDNLTNYWFEYKKNDFDWYKMTMITGFGKKSNTSKIEVKINADFIECLVAKCNWMTFYDINMICSFPHASTMRIYEIIVGRLSEITFPLSELIKLVGSSVKMPRDMNRILNLAQKDMKDNNSDWNFTYSYTKKENDAFYTLKPIPNEPISSQKSENRFNDIVTQYFLQKGFTEKEISNNYDTIKAFLDCNNIKNKQQVLNELWIDSKGKNTPKGYFIKLIQITTEDAK